MVSEEQSTVTLREYVDARFEAIKEAISKADAAADRRFEGVNEFRGQLADQTRTLLPRPEAEQKFYALEDKLNRLTSRMDARDNRGRGADMIWAYLIGALGVGALVASLFIRTH